MSISWLYLSALSINMVSLLTFRYLEKFNDHCRQSWEKFFTQHSIRIRNWHKFNNLLISLLHSSVASLGSLIILYQYPNLSWDLVHEFHVAAYLLPSFSCGYFVSDILSNIRRRKLFNRSWKDSCEVVTHHIVVITDLLIAQAYMRYVGGLIIALLAEVNNIFLHLRSLFLLLDFPIALGTKGIWITHLNVISSLLFRCLPLTLITYRFTFDLKSLYPDIPVLDLVLVIISLLLLFTYKNVLTYRIIQRDYKPHLL